MTPADVQANKKKEIEIQDLILQVFIRRTFKTCKTSRIQCKMLCIFHLILVGILSNLILSIKNRGAGVCLTDKIH